MNNYSEQFEKDGYFVVENAITEEQAVKFRALCDNYFDNYPTSPFIDGFTVPGWAGITPAMGELNHFHEQKEIVDIAKLALGSEDIVYTNHSDLHKNIVTLWHRDHFDFGLGDPASEPFKGFDQDNHWPEGDETLAPEPEEEWFIDGFWDEGHRIIKMCLLLQDHTDNELGLHVKAGSNKKGVKGEERCIHSSATDLIVFDHRIMHRGQLNARQFHKVYPQYRCFLAWGFGLDNKYTQQFSRGCNERQAFGREKIRQAEEAKAALA